MGSMQGLDTGLGTLLGILLRGYTSRLHEDEDRKAREQQAAALGLTLPKQEERSYLNRVLSPNAWHRTSEQQRSLMEALQEMHLKTALEQTKQGLIGDRQVRVADVQGGHNMGLAQFKASAAADLTQFSEREAMERLKYGEAAAMGRLQYSKATPQALDPSTVAANQGRAASSLADALLNQEALNLVRRMGFGGPALSGSPGIAGTVGPASTPTTMPPAPTGGGFEYGLPSIKAGPLTLAPHETLERKTQIAAAETAAREGAQPLAGEQAKRYEALLSIQRNIQAVREQITDPATGGARSDYTGPVQGALIGPRRLIPETVGGLSTGQAVFSQALADAKQQLLYARSGAQINEHEYQRMLAALPSEQDRDDIFLAGLDRFERELTAAIDRTQHTASTGKGALQYGPPRALTWEEQLDQQVR